MMDPGEELRYLVLGAQREGNRMLADLLRPLNLTPSQAEVLHVLQNAGPLSLGDVGRRLVCETGSPSQLLDGLVRSGLVERIPASDDRQRVELSLTDEGRRKARAARRVERKLHLLIEALVSPEDLSVASRVLWLFLAERPAGDALTLRRESKVGR
jgi:DNA-binding MarR family transcriptional regulator